MRPKVKIFFFFLRNKATHGRDGPACTGFTAATNPTIAFVKNFTNAIMMMLKK